MPGGGITVFVSDRLGDPVDQRILELFMGADGHADSRSIITRDSFVLSEPLAEVIVPVLARSGRFVLWDGQDNGTLPPPCRWDEREPWVVRYAIIREENGTAFHLRGRFERGEERLALTEPEVALAPGILFLRGVGAPFTAPGDFRWVNFLRRRGAVRIPAKEIESFLTEIEGKPPIANSKKSTSSCACCR